MTTFAKPTRSRIVPALEVATVIASLLLGAAFGARLLAERGENEDLAHAPPAIAERFPA